MQNSILKLVGDFAEQAATNSNSQNKKNLNDLLNLQKEMKTSFSAIN